MDFVDEHVNGLCEECLDIVEEEKASAATWAASLAADMRRPDMTPSRFMQEYFGESRSGV